MKHALKLTELNRLVRLTIEKVLPDEYWVETELSEVREVRGHCYMELIQKDSETNTPVAKASAKCWRTTWMAIRPHFERVTGQRIAAGMKVLLKVYAQFHENYGFSWIITDIDPTYTMGDMARKRKEIIQKLKAYGVFELNKELKIPMFAQRIAVISSPTAAGYGDFCNQLDKNQYGFIFSVSLFTAVMQGEQVEQSIISALNDINNNAESFDCVVIIRGGGATSDLSGFDTFSLAENVANFPLPVITGIGHERDESVLDMVANTRAKTPTAAAAFLIDNLKNTLERIERSREIILRTVKLRMETEHMRVDRISSAVPILFALTKTRNEAKMDRLYERLTTAIKRLVDNEKHRIDNYSNNISVSLQRKITKEHHRLELLTHRAKAADPTLLLRRGYSITLHNGHAVRNPGLLKHGDEIVTKVYNGTFISKVETIQPETDEDK